MTGEVTLRGRVLPIGGLKEKILAAHRAGITTVLIPDDNRKDLKDVPEAVLAQLAVHPGQAHGRGAAPRARPSAAGGVPARAVERRRLAHRRDDAADRSARRALMCLWMLE